MHSALIQYLQQHGSLSFFDFMQQALYHPIEGYYCHGKPKFGKAGDFMTAPEYTPLFGKALAHACLPLLEQLEQPILLEVGAGSGKLCVDLLRALRDWNHLPEQYWILELSPSLRQTQQAYVAEQLPELYSRVTWLDRWPTQKIQGILIANEVLDAMPVQRFLHTEQGFFENWVQYDEQKGFTECFKPLSDPALLPTLLEHFPLKQYPYLSEIHPLHTPWIQSAAECFSKGAMLLLDYGFPRAEYYHPDRNQGTLMCHYQHRAHPNPYVHVGSQDITSHVDFTLIAEAAQKAGWAVTGYTHQAAFLINNRILEYISVPETPNKNTLESQHALQLLLHPAEMGELFKIIALSSDQQLVPGGFERYNKQAQL
ncbi:MAG: SAM-dependent methyltransferase [Legionellaceae bacterium]|nr:SAM-dependent methyltransferase [Legionellaceae bacterium]